MKISSDGFDARLSSLIVALVMALVMKSKSKNLQFCMQPYLYSIQKPTGARHIMGISFDKSFNTQTVSLLKDITSASNDTH